MKYLFLATTFLVINYAIAQQNVGIGTTTPIEKLHINGNLKADTLKPNAIKLTPNAGLNKVLTSDAAGNATWKISEKSIFKATGFEATFTVAPSTRKILTDWKNVELNIGANSIFNNAIGDLFILKAAVYRISAKISFWIDDPGDSHYVELSILVNGTRRFTSKLPVPTNDDALSQNVQDLSLFVSSIFQLNAMDKISFEFYNDPIFISRTSARFDAGDIANRAAEFTVEQLF